MKTIISAFIHHAGWVSGLVLLIYALSGMYTGQLNQSSALLPVVSGLGLLGVHFNSK